MASLLLEIQETVMKYADIMSKIAYIEVEVVDESLYRVAGTGIFKAHINEDMSAEGYVYRHIIRTGNTEIIYEPGREKLCQSCPKKNICKEEIEISMPVRLGGDIIGVIGLVGSTKQQKALILSKEAMYLELLGQIADFIAVKAAEVDEMKKRAALLDMLDCVINHIERGIVILDAANIITMTNEAAMRQLSMDGLEGLHAVITPTGDALDRKEEYIMLLNHKKYYIMGHLYDLERDTKRHAKVLLFYNSRDLQERYYEITSTVNPLIEYSIIGVSRQTVQLRDEIKNIAKSTSTVLLTGESGTGKELVATAIWKASNRRNNRFVAINCGAIAEPLLESELFGYVKGAFTGADPNGRMGKFELADKGVIFLDEIGDMPLYLQVKLLRVLQERKITRVGSNQVIAIDVRVIAATNKNLKQMMQKNKFREDLYYRLNVIPLRIAPLRERPEDVQELLAFFADRYAKLFGKKLTKISEEAMAALCAYPWLGNVRELENTIEYMINRMGDDGMLDLKTMPDNFFAYGQVEYEQQACAPVALTQGTKLPEGIRSLRELERQEIDKALLHFGTDTKGKKQAAKALGIGLATLYRKIEQFSEADI